MLIGFIANIILARTLGPEIFGQVAIVLFFITISKVLVESGLSGALIRRDKVSDIDYSTVLIFNIAVSILLTIIIFFFAFLKMDKTFLEKLTGTTSSFCP